MLDLSSLTREQLRHLARQANLTGYGKMGAKDLAKWLKGRLPQPKPQTQPVVKAKEEDELFLDDEDEHESLKFHWTRIDKLVKRANQRV